MKVRIKGDISGSRNGVPWPKRGEVMELPADEGAQLCASGLAIPFVVHEGAEPRPLDDNVETRPARKDGIETRALTTESAADITPSAPEVTEPTAKKAAAPAKKTTTAAKKAAAPAKPQAESK